jgi:hypothetical protein
MEGAKEKALNIAQFAMKQFPKQFKVHICLTRAYIACNDFVKALETLNSAPIPDVSHMVPEDT